MDQVTTMTLKEKNRIIRIGKANDRMNKHMGKVVIPPVALGSGLIILYSFVKETAVMLWGMGFLFGGCLIPLVWFASLAIRASRCKNYSYDLYQHLVKDYSPNEVPSFRVIQETPKMTQDIADEQFDGDINKAIDYIIKNVRGDELNAYIEEWGPEQAAAAIGAIYNAGKEVMGDKKLERFMKAHASLAELEITEEEALSSPNPYKKKVWVQIAILAGVCVCVPLLLAAFQGSFSDPETVRDWVLLGLGGYITIQAAGIAESLSKAVKFAKAKKTIMEINAEEAAKAEE